MLFFILFLDGKGDLINNVIMYDIVDNIIEVFVIKLKYLIKFGENIDGKWVYRFVFYLRFVYWVYNMLYRRRILG